MSEKTIRIQQTILPERLERMISDELIRISGTKVGFSLSPTEYDGVVKVNVSDEALTPFIEAGVIDIVEISPNPDIGTGWNDIAATYQLDDGVDIEDVF